VYLPDGSGKGFGMLYLFECRVLPERDLPLYQLVVSVVVASFGGDTVQCGEGFGARLEEKI
jgi:hypothetical protein